MPASRSTEVDPGPTSGAGAGASASAEAGPGVRRGRGDLPDLLFGLFLLAVAAVALVSTWPLRMGVAADMGPGYMPRAIALILGAFGAVFALRGLRRGGAGLAVIRPRPVLIVLAAVAVFAGLVEHIGLAFSALATIVVAGFASEEHRLLEGLLFGAALAAAAVWLFISVLSLPVPVWPW